MKTLGRLFFYFTVINYLISDMTRYVDNNFKWMFPEPKPLFVHPMAMIMERLDNKMDNSYMKMFIDIAPSFPYKRIYNAVFYSDFFINDQLFPVLILLIAKETVDTKSLEVGQSTVADIDVFGALLITIRVHRTAKNSYNYDNVYWHRNWPGLVKRAAHA